MAVIAIHNEDWGFETNCFVCEPRNQQGLRIPFFHDTDAEMVTATYTLSNDFSGAPTLIHGGVTLAILDEAMAWACIAVGQRWAVTTETNTRFVGGMYIGKEYRVEARVDGSDDSTMRTSAQVIDGKGRVRAEAAATFAVLGEAQATRVVGGDLGDKAAQYLKPS